MDFTHKIIFFYTRSHARSSYHIHHIIFSKADGLILNTLNCSIINVVRCTQPEEIISYPFRLIYSGLDSWFLSDLCCPVKYICTKIKCSQVYKYMA